MDPFDDMIDKAIGNLKENVETQQLYLFYSQLAKHMNVGIKAFEDAGFSNDTAYEMVSNIVLLSIENTYGK